MCIDELKQIQVPSIQCRHDGETYYNQIIILLRYKVYNLYMIYFFFEFHIRNICPLFSLLNLSIFCLWVIMSHVWIYNNLDLRLWVENGKEFWHTPKLLDGFNSEFKGENNERKRNWGTLPSSQHFGGRGVCWSSGMGLGYLLTRTCTNQTISWLMCNCSTLVHGRATGKHRFTRLTTTRTWGKPPPSLL